MFCMFDDNCPEEASALGIKPERFDRPSETTEFHHVSETTGFQYESREYAMSDIVDIPLLTTYVRISKLKIQREDQCLAYVFFTEPFPCFIISAHTTRLVGNRRW